MEIVESSHVGDAWAGMYVRFDLLTWGDMQYVGYWDAQRRLVVARRTLGASPGEHSGWVSQVLDETLGWDSHHHISLGLDREGHLHVSGNMHNDPMVYFRTTEPGDVATLERHDHVVDPTTEQSVTYPEFLTRPDGRLVFSHRDGGSGDGVTFLCIYDEASRVWERLLDQPLFGGSAQHGEGPWSAYFEGPELGPDGAFHLLWMWRETPDAATNSLLSYARSEDLLTWTDAHGRTLKVPFTYGSGDIVDPVPARAGLLNGNARLGFDADGGVHVTYHKYDDAGSSQVYAARPAEVTSGEDLAESWEVRRLTDWSRRWDFGGHGTLVFEVQVLGSRILDDGGVRVDVRCFGEELSILTDQELRPLSAAPRPSWPGGVGEVRGDFPGLRVAVLPGRRRESRGDEYVLRWESLPENRDEPSAEYPQSSPLEVVRLARRPPEGG